jgi:hypothetical protein
MSTGAVDFGKDVDSSLLAAHLAVRLREVDASEVEVRNNRVTFSGGIFRFVTNWNILVSFGFGDLTVDSDTSEIRYRLSYRQLVIASAAMFVVMCVFLLAFSGTQGIISGTWTIFALLLMWLCVGFMNVTIGVWRFKRFLGRATGTAPRVRPMGAPAQQ